MVISTKSELTNGTFNVDHFKVNVSWCVEVNDTAQDTRYQEFYHMAQMITGLVIYPLVCFPGVLGNTLTLFVLSRRNMQTSTNAFLSALAISDSVKLINDILYFFVIVFMKTSSTLGNLSYGYLYPYAHFIFSLSACVSSWLTVSMAVERYLMVCHPTRVRAVWSRKRAVVLCTLIYVVMTLLALPSALRYRTIGCVDVKTNVTKLDVELTKMWQNEVFVKSYTWAQNLLRSIIPLIVLVVLNTCIISALRRSQAKKRKNARHRVTVMMIVVILAFLICITPDAIMSTAFGFGYHEADYLPRAIREITDALLAINAGINFLIYCVFNQVFRKSFIRLCCHQKRSPNWMTELEESTYRRWSDVKSLIMSNNNSPPRNDTSPTMATDNSMVSYQNLTNGRHQTDDVDVPVAAYCLVPSQYVSSIQRNSELDPKPPTIFTLDNEEEDTLRPNSNQEDSSYSDKVTNNPIHKNCYNNIQEQTHNLNPQHHHRISKDGLKKSRNSIKCIRERHRSTVPLEEDEEWNEKERFEILFENGEVQKTLDSNIGLKTTENNGYWSPFYQNQLLTKVCACVHTVSSSPCSSVSDQCQLDKLRTCDGVNVTCKCQDLQTGHVDLHSRPGHEDRKCNRVSFQDRLHESDRGDNVARVFNPVQEELIEQQSNEKFKGQDLDESDCDSVTNLCIEYHTSSPTLSGLERNKEKIFFTGEILTTDL